MIQGTNISMMRDVGVYLDDALPSLAPDVRRRRYINDRNLMGCLDLLAKHSQLQHVKLQIHGRRRLGWSFEDTAFLTALKKIKADKVGFGFLDETDERSDEWAVRPYSYTRGRNIERLMVPILRNSMVRGGKQAEEGPAQLIS